MADNPRENERSQVKGVILDVDGTLIDSNDAHANAWVETLRKGGYDVTFQEVRPLIGMGSDKLLPATAGVEKDSLEGKKLTEQWKQIFQEKYLPNLKPFPGSHELVLKLKAEKFKVAVASSSEKDLLDKLLKIAGAEDLIEEKTSSGDAKESKPSPDIVGAALKRLGLTAESAIMIGDTPYDVEAAAKLGVPTIGLTCGGWSAKELAGAVAVYRNPADLLEHLEESPLKKGVPPRASASR
jgi:HAD superfamily hydrolase (TIGR01509 family)